MNNRIAAVIPCYRVRAQLPDVVRGVLGQVDHVYCIDDACPEQSGRVLEQQVSDPRLTVLYNTSNLGVGGAVKEGYRAALQDGFDIVVKIDGDGQMDPALIPELCGPIRDSRADYCKGNRFFELSYLQSMPALRLFGNTVLSLLSKLSSGYWRILDPTNGFTAIHAEALRSIPLNKVADRYFFESDLLFRLNIARAVVQDVPMRAKYGAEKSSMRIHEVILPFLLGHMRNVFKRVFYTYFLRDFNIATLELLAGFGLTVFGLVFGISAWSASVSSGTPASAGTVMLAGLSFLLGVQFLLAFLNYDIQNAPALALCDSARYRASP